VLLNTSFNRKEPIVASPKDAVSCYLLSGMDVLVLGDFYTTDRKGPSREAHEGAAPAEVAATPSAVAPLSRG
jgi:hypothetical protein